MHQANTTFRNPVQTRFSVFPIQSEFYFPINRSFRIFEATERSKHQSIDRGPPTTEVSEFSKPQSGQNTKTSGTHNALSPQSHPTSRVSLLNAQRKFLRVRRGCQASQRKGLTSGEVRGTSGEVRGTSGELLDCCSVPQ